MSWPSNCLGHQLRVNRRNKISSLATSSKESPDENYRALINKGPVSVETSLKELEDNYESKLEWKIIEKATRESVASRLVYGFSIGLNGFDLVFHWHNGFDLVFHCANEILQSRTGIQNSWSRLTVQPVCEFGAPISTYCA